MTVSQQDHFVNLVLKLLSNDEPLDTIYKTLIEFFELGKRVIVEDIQTDPLWEQYRDLAKSANVASCWSQPIKAQKIFKGSCFSVESPIREQRNMTNQILEKYH